MCVVQPLPIEQVPYTVAQSASQLQLDSPLHGSFSSRPIYIPLKPEGSFRGQPEIMDRGRPKYLILWLKQR